VSFTVYEIVGDLVVATFTGAAIAAILGEGSSRTLAAWTGAEALPGKNKTPIKAVRMKACM
jgi:hypothetical protein